jgi:hypothetical protein
MVRFPTPALAVRRFLDLLVDDFQRISLACPHSRSAQKRAQRSHVAPLPANDFAHVTLGDFQFDHVAIEMVHKDLIGSIDDPLRNLLEERAHISSGFSHGGLVELWLPNLAAALPLCRGNRRGGRGLGEQLAHPL